MTYPARLGLLLLLILSPLIITSHSSASLSVTQTNDADQLFVEAMKLAEGGQRAEANKRLDEACLLWTKRRDPERAARARLQIGDVYRNDKSFNDSLNQYRQILQIQGLSPSLKALTYDAQGQIYDELYQPELSLHNYSKALALVRDGKDYAVEAQVQLNLASLSSKGGDFERALELAQSAVVASRKADDQKALASSLGFLAQMELKNGLIEKGRSDLDRALSLYQENKDLPAQIKVLCFLSSLNLSARQISLAEEQAQSARKMTDELERNATNPAQKLKVSTLRWSSWLALARAQKAAQQLDAARKSYWRAITSTTVAWWTVYASTERSALGFAEERQAAYRELVDTYVELGQIEEAYDSYQYARVRTLAGFIRGRHLVGFRNENTADNEINALSASVIELRTRLLSPALTKAQRETLKQELVETENELAEKRFKAELKHPKRKMVFSLAPTLPELQTQLLGADEVLFEYCLGNERSFLWRISRESVDFEILPSRKEIEGKVRQYLDELSVAPPNLQVQSRIEKQRVAADSLFKTIFGKLANKLPANTKLIVSPDGLLSNLPFESLVHNDRYLIEDHQISYLPSASMIALRQSKSATDSNGKLELLAFGDPVFQRPSNVSLSRNLAKTRSANDEQAPDWDITKLLRLPRSRDEVEYIAKLIPNEQTRLYLGKDSTEKAFKQETLGKYDWIHLATHSLVDVRNPGRSAVVLGIDSNNEEDGFLRATEIVDLDLNCDLVTLSACETGRGQLLSGEGVIGLSRSFLIAGARSVVVSQWAVSDISTAELMKDFYQQMVSGVAKPAALRNAKLRMLRSTSETRHPYYWAPFVIIGAP